MMRLQVAVFAALLAALTLVQSAPITSDEIETKSAQGYRLLSIVDGEDPVWKTEDEKLQLMREEVQFFDVTDVYELEQKLATKEKKVSMGKAAFPTPSKQSEVKPLLNTISTSNMKNYLANLTSFNNRYYTSSTGLQASNWILNTVSDIADDRGDVTVSKFSHRFQQFSIVAKIPGSEASTPVTILGSHMDSINLNSPSSGRAPGADDDGTGSVNLIEAFRALIAADFKPSTPVEFHWYAAEEVGLLGSQDIADSYADDNIDVLAFMELDMSGYFKPGTKEVMAIQADYIDDDLNDFLGEIIDTYASIPWTMDIACGYACSDHASWYKAGYPSTFPYEAVTGNDNPRIHSSSDTTSVTGFSWTHSLEFAKVAVAFVYELAA
ncbi:Zn-dependent exopeptidase [Armillaria solidipes]|uniref:Peptide hydrolase n=2 Tax=Armillaria TaxID=47424 RepID=A0A2H3BS48_9AGAR|nr:Zn-dependent exopeptidase [Armillaria solidipes]